MLGNRLKRYKGLVVLISGLVLFIISVVILRTYIDSVIVQRETFARAKTLNFVDMIERFGTSDPALVNDINDHVKMFVDGGRLATSFGPAWDYPPVTTQAFIDHANKVNDAYDRGDMVGFETSYQEFDTYYGTTVQGRQRILLLVQYAAAGVIFLGFLGVLSLLFFRLGKADDVADATRRENEHILASTKEGVFLIDSAYTIGEQRSDAVQALFGDKVAIEGNFLAFIKDMVPSKDFERVEKFLGLVFGGRAKPKLMADLNPLQNVELTVDRKLGGPVRRILNFDFSRDEQSDSVDNLLVTISDITQQTILKEELEATQSVQNERLNLLKGILHVDPTLLRQFIEKGKSTYKQINELLEEGSVNPDNNVERIDEIGRLAHRLKGDASALRLDLFENSIHRFEDTIDELRKNNLLDGQSLLKLVVHLKNMIAELDLAASLTGEYSSQAIMQIDSETPIVGTNQFGDVKSVAEAFTYKLNSLADEVAQRNGKQVNFSINGAGHLEQLPSLVEPLTEIAVQLVRNAVLHGIETPEERDVSDKPKYGKVHIAIEQRSDHLKMQVMDDGRGLDFEKIEKRAIEGGLIPEREADTVNKKRLLQILFSHGFSSRSDVNQDGGRGVGLDAVKILLNEWQGRINVGSTINKQTSFTVHLPIFSGGEGS